MELLCWKHSQLVQKSLFEWNLEKFCCDTASRKMRILEYFSTFIKLKNLINFTLNVCWNASNRFKNRIKHHFERVWISNNIFVAKIHKKCSKIYLNVILAVILHWEKCYCWEHYLVHWTEIITEKMRCTQTKSFTIYFYDWEKHVNNCS